jgi:hypothetical protein
MESIFTNLSDYGIVGAVLALLFYQVFYLQRKVFSIIENNTKAMGELKSMIEKCQLQHDGRESC